jgi:aminopeptidase N
MRAVLRHSDSWTPAFKELVLTLPSEAYIAEQLPVVDPQRIHAVREAMRLQLATRFARPTGSGPSMRTRTTAATGPTQRPRPGVRWRGLALATLCLAARARHGDASGRARPCSASRTPTT